MKYHTPVLLQEIIRFLDPGSGKRYIDATVGGGGHTFELLKYGARVLGIDRDPEAIEYVREKWKVESSSPRFAGEEEKWKIGENLILVQGNFSHIGDIARKEEFDQVSGIIFDLGVSSHQIEKAQRGFSFQQEGPLDMRMDPNLTVQAYDIVNNFDKRRLNEIFKTYGQERFSWTIASAIVGARQIKPVETTLELSQIIDEVLPQKGQKFTKWRIGEIAKSFQALRIIVNSELLNLEEGLPQTVELLQKGGRLAIVSFHSLEERVVKRFFKQEMRLQALTEKPIGPSENELSKNPRSRSAKLRVVQKK